MSNKVKVLFWYEAETVGTPYAWFNRFCRCYGCNPLVIDTLGHFPNEANAFSSLDEAVGAYADHTFVFMDPHGEHVLDEFEHPEGAVVYATGAYVDGFGVPVGGLGYTVRLRDATEWPALLVVSMMLYDRQLFFAGRRN